MEDIMLLPDNLMLDVLSILRMKTIINCKCVCKKWRELVSDPYFVHLHLSRSRQCLMIHECGNRYIFNRSPETLECVEEIQHEADHYHLDSVMRINHKHCDPDLEAYFGILQVGSVNGLICCCSPYNSIYIFNPVFEENIILSQPRSNSVTLFYGFGVSTAREYKVIRIFSNRVFVNQSEPKVDTVEIDVCTIGSKQWRTVGQIPFQLNLTEKVEIVLILNGPDPGVYLDSHVYWLLGGQICNFDLNMETSELFPSPPAHEESKQMLGVLKGSLSCICWCSLGLEVWMMKGGSWYKEIAIQENMSCS